MKPDKITEDEKRLLRRTYHLLGNSHGTVLWGSDMTADRLVRQGYFWTRAGISYGLTDKGRKWARNDQKAQGKGEKGES